MPSQPASPNGRLGEDPAMAWLRNLIKNPRPDLPWNHEVGRCLSEMRLGSDRSPYGTNQIKSLARELGVTDTLLHRSIRFSKLYNQKAAAALSRRGVTWTVMQALIDVKDAVMREQLLNDSLRHNWSIRTLKAEKLKRVGYRRRGGSPPYRPQESLGLEADLGNLSDISRRWLYHVDEVWDGGKLKLRTDISDQLLARIHETVERVYRISQASEELLAKLKALEDRAKRK